jgi:hypothetical protein
MQTVKLKSDEKQSATGSIILQQFNEKKINHPWRITDFNTCTTK